jgi:iron-sulfur cluster assembly protein
MFTVTPQAAEQIRKSMPENESPALRIAAKMMDDGSVEVGMGFDEQREFDFEIVTNGINVLIGSSSRDVLEGVTLDFVEIQPGQFNFIFIPPEDKRPTPPSQPSAGGCGAAGCGSGGCGGGGPSRPRCK